MAMTMCLGAQAQTCGGGEPESVRVQCVRVAELGVLSVAEQIIDMCERGARLGVKIGGIEGHGDSGGLGGIVGLAGAEGVGAAGFSGA